MRKAVGNKTLLGALVLGGALLLAGHSVFGQAPAGGAKAPHTMTGVVTDDMCGGNHNGKDAAKCTVSCASKGKYALMIGDRKVTLDEVPAADMAKFAGMKATVTGTMSGKDNMKVTKIEAAKDAS